MTIDHRCAYGLACAVNFDWTWCPAASSGRKVELALSLGNPGRFEQYSSSFYTRHAQRPSNLAAAQQATVVVDRGADGHFRVSYRDGAQFFIDHTASEVFGISRSDLTVDDLVVYLQGPILGFLLRLRGVTCLHASAAVVDGRAVGVVGNGGMGKSTTAAMFAKLGIPVLTDDVLALRDNGRCFDVQPGHSRVLLWPESVALLFGNKDALPRLVSTWDKRYLNLDQPAYQFAQRPAPLGAIYVLGERLSAGAPPEITALSGVEGLMKLVANTYANDFIDADMRASELKVLARMSQNVPIRLLRAPDDRAAIPRVCEALIADFRSLA